MTSPVSGGRLQQALFVLLFEFAKHEDEVLQAEQVAAVGSLVRGRVFEETFVRRVCKVDHAHVDRVEAATRRIAVPRNTCFILGL